MCWIAAYRRSISEVTCHWVRSCLLIPQNRIFFHVRCWEACWGLPPRVWWRSVADAGDQVSLPSFHLQVRKTNHERVREGEPTFFYLFAGVAKCQASAEKARFVASLMSCYFRKCIAEQALSIPKVEITVTFVSFFLLKKSANCQPCLSQKMNGSPPPPARPLVTTAKAEDVCLATNLAHSVEGLLPTMLWPKWHHQSS